MDTCVHDALYLFVIVAFADLLLYCAIPCKFSSFVTRVVFSAELGLLLKTVVETGVGEYVADWPQDVQTNLFMTFMFSCFFYVISGEIWCTLFLFLGLMSNETFWDPVYDQICSFFQHALNITMSETEKKAAFAAIVVFIFFVIAMAIFFSVPIIQTIAMGIAMGIKAVISIKVIHVRLVDKNSICCSKGSDPDLCPIWFSTWEWLLILGLCVSRISASRYYEKHPCSKKGYYLLSPSKEVPTKEGLEGDELEGIDVRKPRSSIPGWKPTRITPQARKPLLSTPTSDDVSS